jgi:hypothetical protein
MFETTSVAVIMTVAVVPVVKTLVVVKTPVLLIVAIVVSLVVQVANDVIFWVVVLVPSDCSNVAVAVSWWLVPTNMYGLAGVMARDCGSVT